MLARLAVDALAVARLTRLVVADTWPPAERARQRAVDYVAEKHGEEWAAGVTCPHCVSVYLAAGVALARRFAPRAWGPVAEFLALAQVTSTLATWEDGANAVSDSIANAGSAIARALSQQNGSK